MRDVPAALAAALSPRYRLERELGAVGAGGMATVYLARDLKHDRDVAIKVLRADVAAAAGVDRFLGIVIRPSGRCRSLAGTPRLLVRFDDPSRRSPRREFATDGQRFHFTVARDESDIWAMELVKK